MKFDPKEDGITHINVYSKGKTELGRFLSNFTRSPIETEDGPFESVEGYWYWLGCKDDRLRKAWGFKAKELGRQLGASDWLEEEVFKDKIRKAITIKLENYEELVGTLKASRLPLTHYYVYGDKVVNVSKAGWILEHIESLRGTKK